MFYSKESKIVSLEIFDVIGKSILKTNKQISVGENKIEIDLSDINSGIYFLKVDATTQKIQVIK
jgi:hypothetical protein